jgi:pyridoxine 5-phosphate synthase
MPSTDPLAHVPCRLSVNLNKIATLRNARGGNVPDLLQVARDVIAFGAQGITVHPRPDERHIRRQDVLDLAQLLRDEVDPALGIEFNIEGYPSPDWLGLVARVKSTQATLVPDPPEAITSSAGWDAHAHREQLRPVLADLRAQGIRTSLFVEARADAVRAAAEVGTDRVELYTGPYAERYRVDPASAVAPFAAAAQEAARTDLGLNAGHDLSLANLAWLRRHLPNLLEVSIGHALIADALYLGLHETVRRYRSCLT